MPKVFSPNAALAGFSAVEMMESMISGQILPGAPCCYCQSTLVPIAPGDHRPSVITSRKK